MKKSILIFITVCICCSVLGCDMKKDILDEEIQILEGQIAALQSEKKQIEQDIQNLKGVKVEMGIAKYIVTFKIKQKHYNLSSGEYFKDKMNAFTIQIPVDKEFYDSVAIGDTIVDKFRVGSWILYGSFGGWNITVDDKYIQ